MKTIILFISLCFFVFFVDAQTIEWHVFKGTTANHNKILKIELTETAMVMDFREHVLEVGDNYKKCCDIIEKLIKQII